MQRKDPCTKRPSIQHRILMLCRWPFRGLDKRLCCCHRSNLGVSCLSLSSALCPKKSQECCLLLDRKSNGRDPVSPHPCRKHQDRWCSCRQTSCSILW